MAGPGGGPGGWADRVVCAPFGTAVGEAGWSLGGPTQRNSRRFASAYPPIDRRLARRLLDGPFTLRA